MSEFGVRKTDDMYNKWTVADGDRCRTSNHYIERDGAVGLCVSYDTEAEAQTALDLYLKSQEPDREFEVGARVRVVADEEQLGVCGIVDIARGAQGVIKARGCDNYHGSPHSYEVLLDGENYALFFPSNDLELIETVETVETERTFVGHPEGVLEVKERGPHGYCLECEKKIAEAKHRDIVPVCGECQPFSHHMVNKETTTIRTFDTGATRDTDQGKLDYEGFLHPAVIERYAEYLNKHRIQSDGKLRDSDNWQKGLPIAEYMKSKFRHFMDTWLWHRCGPLRAGHKDIDIEDTLCAELFNTQGMLLEIMREED